MHKPKIYGGNPFPLESHPIK